MKICRLCLRESRDAEFISVFCHEQDQIVEKIHTFVSITISDKDTLPTTVCLTCLNKINDWSDFRETCLKANEILLSIAAQTVGEVVQEKEGPQSDNEEEEIQYLLVEEKEKYSQEKDALREDIDNTEGNTYKCEICNGEFSSCLEYLDHQPNHNGVAVFKCDKCPEVFSCREDLLEHDVNHKRPCPKCGKLILKNSMKLHLIKHTDRHMCSQCKSRFNSKAALHQHCITIHTDRKDHICETCGKRFSSKTAMTVHSRSHSDERLYNCKLCNYSGRTASAVYVHMSTHSNEVCVCEVCSKIFKSTRNLNDHLRRVHTREKKHQCAYCDKKFVDKYMLTVHVRCHTGIRPYQCKMCDKAFIRSDGLKEHMATHGQRVWYECEVCKKKFTSKKGVNRHHCVGNSVN